MNNEARCSLVLALARAGASSRAWAAFVEAGLNDVKDDARVLTLKGRLLKDQARRARGEAQGRLFKLAADAYADAAALRPDTYPLINAATMSLFAGQHGQMENLAREVLHFELRGAGTGETPYWQEATRAEAFLLLGHQSEASSALAAAVRHAPMAWEDHATTLRQFREISVALHIDSAWLNRFSPPPTLCFGGMMGIAPDDQNARDIIIEKVIAAGPGFGFGAPAAGADILIAETLVAEKAELHLMLPAMPSIFKSQSVVPFGDMWGQRFDRLCTEAASVEVIGNGAIVSAASIAVASMVAKGMAVDKAQRMESRSLSLQVVDEHSADPSADIIVRLPRTARAPDVLAIEQSTMRMLIAGQATETRELVSDAKIVSSLQDQEIMEFRDFPAAVKAIGRLSAAGVTAAAHLVIAPVNEPSPEAELARIARMVRAAPGGSVVASRDAAMAVKSENAGTWLEPLGELPDQGGALSMFAVDTKGIRFAPIAETQGLA